jgi:hypothetical protein
VIALVDRLNEGGEPAIEKGEVDAMLAHRLFVVRLHRHRFAADHGDPFGVGFAREGPHGGGIVRHRAPQRWRNGRHSGTTEVAWPRTVNFIVSTSIGYRLGPSWN